MRKKLVCVMLTIFLMSTMYSFTLNAQANNGLLLEIDNKASAKFIGRADTLLIQEITPVQRWRVESISFYGYFDADIEVGIKESKSATSWLSKLEVDNCYNSGSWESFNIPDVTLAQNEKYYVVLRVVGGDAVEIIASENEYPSGVMYFSTNDGQSYSEYKQHDLFLKIYGYEAQKNHYAVLIGCGDQWQEKSAKELKYKIDDGFWTDILMYTGSQVTVRNVENAINWLYNKGQSGDCTLLFYYAGHSTKNAITTENRDRINDVTLMSWFSKFSSSDKLVLIFETCYSGRLDDSKSTQKSSKFLERFSLFNDFLEKHPILSRFIQRFSNDNGDKLVTLGYDDVENPEDGEDNESYDGVFINLVAPGRIVISACKSGQSAWQKRNSIAAFTYFLIDALGGTDYIETAFYSAQTATYTHMRQIEGKWQKPQMADRIPGTVRIKS